MLNLPVGEFALFSVPLASSVCPSVNVVSSIFPSACSVFNYLFMRDVAVVIATLLGLWEGKSKSLYSPILFTCSVVAANVALQRAFCFIVVSSFIVMGGVKSGLGPGPSSSAVILNVLAYCGRPRFLGGPCGRNVEIIHNEKEFYSKSEGRGMLLVVLFWPGWILWEKLWDHLQ
jgi:hypothetical protein